MAGGDVTNWRLGIDLGTNSLGWAALRLGADGRPAGIIAAGSRIFSDGRDPKSGASLAVDRREARAMRRRRDRFQQRQRALMKYLVADGLFPAEREERRALETLDPFMLRATALDEALPLHHLGRAIWHLNQRRGFRSNRKTDRPDDDSGKIKVAVGRLRDAMDAAGARTFGEWLHQRRQPSEDHPDGLPVRTRLRAEPGDNAKGTGYDFYPDRALLEDEFDAIWSAQAEHHPDVLTPEVHDRLYEIVFHQRPLKTPQVGTCTFGSGEPRLPKAHPLFQRRRLLEELNALRIVRAGQVAERLTPEQRDLLLLKLKSKGKVSFESLRKVLKLDPDARFNKESENRTELKGDEVAAAMLTKTRLGNRWEHLSPDEQWEVIERLESAESDEQVEAFRAWVATRFDLSGEQAVAISAARLPQGHGRFGETATRGLIDALTHDRDPDGRVIVYSEAVARLGYHHSDFRTDQTYDELPPYPEILERHLMPGSGDPAEKDIFKRLGRLTNPTVHIGLNQLRRTVNRLIAHHGRPAEIAIELARELKLTEDEKKELGRRNRQNREEAERRSRALLGMDTDGNRIGRPVADDTGANRALLKLWEELDRDNVAGRQCIYTGKQIGIHMLFNGEVEIDHILPLSSTLDDSNANKLLCLREANRFKQKRSPWEAWGHTDQWDEIAERAARLPRNKRWRFEPDAMTRHQEEGGFLARHLADTQYLARLAHEYLGSLYSDRGEGSGRIWVSPGRLTEMVRRKLGLNDLLPDHNFAGGADQPKNRLDHRHHAIDAIVIAIVDRAMLQAISRVSGQEGEAGRERLTVRPPWDGFRDEVATVVRGIVVSHRTDHGTAGHGTGSTAGRLHNDTAYRLTGETDARGVPIVVRRKPLAGLKPAEIGTVRDPDLRAALLEWTAGKDGKALDAALARFATHGPLPFRGIRRARVTETLTVIPIRDREGRVYKGYKGDSNYRYDIWEMPDGRWRAAVISMFDAHQPGERPRPHPAAKRIMRLHRDDVLAIERDGGPRELMRIVKFSERAFVIAPPHEGGALKARDADKGDPFKYVYPSPNTLKSWRARKVDVDEAGRVRDPGFPMRTARRPTRTAAA